MGCSILCLPSHITSGFMDISVFPNHQFLTLTSLLGLETTVVKTVICGVISMDWPINQPSLYTLLGKMEMEPVLSCAHLPCLLFQSFLHLPQICCRVFNPVFVPAWSFEIHYVMSLCCESRYKELKKVWNRDWNRMNWPCLLPVSAYPNSWVWQLKFILWYAHSLCSYNNRIKVVSYVNGDLFCLNSGIQSTSSCHDSCILLYNWHQKFLALQSLI
jgi:hypothetical protein